MKKNLFIIPILLLLAAACNKQPIEQQPSSTSSQESNLPAAQTPPSPQDGTVEKNVQNAPMNGGQTAGATFGFFKSIKINSKTGLATVVFGEEQLFGADEAYRQAAKDWDCGKPNPTGPCDDKGNAYLGDPFYIRDKGTTKQLTISPKAEIKIISLGSSIGVGIKPGTIFNLQKIVDQDQSAFDNKYATQNNQRTPFWIKLNGNTITYIEQQYIP